VLVDLDTKEGCQRMYILTKAEQKKEEWGREATI